MTVYFSTFITGLQEAVEPALKQKLKDVQIDLLLDGLVVYRTDEAPETIKAFRFLNNTFLLLSLSNGKKKYSARDLIKNVLEKPELIPEIPKIPLKGKTNFRVIASEENQIVPIERKLLGKIETQLANILGLKVDRGLPDLEVWFLTRNEGYGIVGLRLTKTPNYEKTLYKGELRPELAHIMCLLSALIPSDLVLDPFAGYGAIPLECSKSFMVSKIFAGEKDETTFKILQEKINKGGSKIAVGKWNALNLSFLTDKSIDKIITDPPWGFYGDTSVDLKIFYKNMLREFIRILKSNGLMVILMAQKEMFEKIISGFKELTLLKKYDTLVSGKKSAIYVIRKKFPLLTEKGN